jgi:hypothetical protein
MKGSKAGNTGSDDDPLGMRAYSDLGHAGDHDTNKSTSGNVILLCSGAVTCSRKRQSTVADSTTAAEIIALHRLTKKVMWMRHMLNWLRYRRDGPTIMACDNRVAVNNCEDGSQGSKTKHMDIKYCFISDVVRHGIGEVKHIGRDELTADILTKPIGSYTHCDGIGLMKGSVKESVCLERLCHCHPHICLSHQFKSYNTFSAQLILTVLNVMSVLWEIHNHRRKWSHPLD